MPCLIPYIKVGFPDMDTFKNIYKAETNKNTFEVEIAPILLQLANDRREKYEKNPKRKNADDLNYIKTLLEDEGINSIAISTTI